MLEPTITCTKCQTVIPLTETLARPYIEAERKKMDEEILERAAAFQKRDAELERRAKELATLDCKLHDDAAEIEKAVEQRLSEERAAISDAEAKKAESQFRAQLEQARSENQQQTIKMAELEKAELEYRNKSAAFDEEKRQLELTLARRLDEERENIRQRVIEDQQKHYQIESEAKDRALSDLNGKLLEAQQAELAVRQERQALESEKQAFELEVARTLDEERKLIREATQKEDDEQHRFKLAEKTKLSMTCGSKSRSCVARVIRDRNSSRGKFRNWNLKLS